MQYQYINCLHQFGLTQNTLLLSCNEGLIADQRIDKIFQGIPSDEELQVYAQIDYDLCLAWTQAQVQQDG